MNAVSFCIFERNEKTGAGRGIRVFRLPDPRLWHGSYKGDDVQYACCDIAYRRSRLSSVLEIGAGAPQFYLTAGVIPAVYAMYGGVIK